MSKRWDRSRDVVLHRLWTRGCRWLNRLRARGIREGLLLQLEEELERRVERIYRRLLERGRILGWYK